MSNSQWVLAFAILLLVQGCAPQPVFTAYEDAARPRFQLAPVDDAALADPDTRTKLEFVYWALAKTQEAAQRPALRLRVRIPPRASGG